MTLFDGNYKYFFNRVGKVPGFLIALCIMALLGPFGALPRCIALSFSTMQLYFPDMTASSFSIVSCLIIFAFTFRKNSIIDVLGVILTPILLGSLAFIIIKGLIVSPNLPISDTSTVDIFLKGLNDGYQTMDLIGAFFFSILNFSGIANMLIPILQVSYPALILLSILNIAYKLFHFKPVKVPVIAVFVASLVGYLIA